MKPARRWKHIKKRKHYKRFRSDVAKGLRKVTVTLSDADLRWLHWVSETMRTWGGYKLPRTYIIRAIIKACMNVDGLEGLNLRQVRTEHELQERIIHAIYHFGGGKDVKRAT